MDSPYILNCFCPLSVASSTSLVESLTLFWTSSKDSNCFSAFKLSATSPVIPTDKPKNPVTNNPTALPTARAIPLIASNPIAKVPSPKTRPVTTTAIASICLDKNSKTDPKILAKAVDFCIFKASFSILEATL